MITKIIVTIQHSIKSQIVWLLSAFPPDFSPDSSLLLFCDGTNTDGTHKTDLINGYDMVAVEGPCLTLDIGDSIEMIGHGTFTSNTGTATFETYDGTTLTCAGAGTAFELKFSDGTIWPCSEGAGDSEDNVTIHDTTGQHSATITVADTPLAMWTDNTQDLYFDAMDRGWHEIDEPDDDGIYYPADPNTAELNMFQFEVVGDSTLTVEGDAYAVGIHTIEGLSGVTPLTVTYGEDDERTNFTGADGASVLGTTPNYTININGSKVIIATMDFPTGLIDDPDIQAVWYFENDLTDATTNSFDLTQSGLSLVYDDTIYKQGAYSAKLTTLADTVYTPEPVISDEFSLGGWVYKVDYDNWEIFYARYDTNDKSFDIGLGTGGQVRFQVSPTADGTGSVQGFGGTWRIPLDVWTHIVCVYDGAYLRIYINGEESVAGDFPMAYSDGVYSASGNVIIGKNVTGNFDELFMFNRALTIAEINDIYAGGF